jgi:hypothetical protein
MAMKVRSAAMGEEQKIRLIVCGRAAAWQAHAWAGQKPATQQAG